MSAIRALAEVRAAAERISHNVVARFSRFAAADACWRSGPTNAKSGKTIAKITRSSAAVAMSLAVLLGAGVARAQSNHTWVSHTGNDFNACTIASPCRTFQAAYLKTAVDGEIDILDPGDYGLFLIGHGLAIVNESAGVASVVGIYVAAGSGDGVLLRGLTFNGIDGITYGVQAMSFGSLVIDHCNFHGLRAKDALTATAINVIPSTASKLLVTDSVLSFDGANGLGAIHIAPGAGGSVSAQIERAQVSDAVSNGVRVDTTAPGAGAAIVELRDVTVHGAAGGSGIVAVSPTSGGAPAVIYADNVAATGNAGYGLRAVGGRRASFSAARSLPETRSASLLRAAAQSFLIRTTASRATEPTAVRRRSRR